MIGEATWFRNVFQKHVQIWLYDMERLHSVSSKYHPKSCSIVFSMFFPKSMTGLGWICKGWRPSRTDLSTSHHRPKSTSCQNCFIWVILQCVVVESMLWLEGSFGFWDVSRYQSLYCILQCQFAGLYHILQHSFCSTEHDWIIFQRMVCQHILLTFQYGSKHKTPQTNPHHLKLATWFCNVS